MTHHPTLLVHMHLALTDAERERLASAAVGWCHICNRDITKASDHAVGCEWSDRGPTHPEIAPDPSYSVVAAEIAEVALLEGVIEGVAMTSRFEVIDCEEL